MPTSLIDLAYQYASKLTNGVALPAPDPWLRALLLAADEQIRLDHEELTARMSSKLDEESKQRRALEAQVAKLSSRLFKLQHRGSDE